MQLIKMEVGERIKLMLVFMLNHRTSNLQKSWLYGFERIEFTFCNPSTPSLAGGGRESSICKSTNNWLLLHSHYCIGPYISQRKWLSKTYALSQSFLQLPDRWLHMHLAGVWKMNTKCQKFITASSPVSPATCIEQRPQDQSLPLSPRFDERVFVTSICLLQNQILTCKEIPPLNSFTQCDF